MAAKSAASTKTFMRIHASIGGIQIVGDSKDPRFPAPWFEIVNFSVGNGSPHISSMQGKSSTSRSVYFPDLVVAINKPALVPSLFRAYTLGDEFPRATIVQIGAGEEVSFEWSFAQLIITNLSPGNPGSVHFQYATATNGYAAAHDIVNTP